ncbi:MAG TPA: peptidylprolyl isomerase [Thermoanaerobaculia bacterium]|nr:peptidylprolyl isomerase [Thermoanaerobaculia bacterium]
MSRVNPVTGALMALEGTIKVKGRYCCFLRGAASPVTFLYGEQHRFAVRLIDDDSVVQAFRLERLAVEKRERWGSRVFVPLTFSRYGEVVYGLDWTTKKNRGARTFLFMPTEPLVPGEYAFSGSSGGVSELNSGGFVNAFRIAEGPPAAQVPPTPQVPPTTQGPPAPQPPSASDKVAELNTSQGTIAIRFFPDVAPNHVRNFIELAQNGYYNGTKFHRVIPGFMIQGGDPNTKTADTGSWGTGGSGRNLKAEFNAVHHVRGIVSMARSQDPDSASSQFFICVADASASLDGKYTVFGQVVSGMDVVDKIVSGQTTVNDRPVDPVEIKSVTIRDARAGEKGMPTAQVPPVVPTSSPTAGALVVNVQRLLSDSQAGKSAFQRLKKMQEDRAEKVKQLPVAEQQAYAKTADAELGAARDRELKELERQMIPVVQLVGRQSGAAAIFNKYESGLVYGSDSIDVTDNVLNGMNGGETGAQRLKARASAVVDVQRVLEQSAQGTSAKQRLAEMQQSGASPEAITKARGEGLAALEKLVMPVINGVARDLDLGTAFNKSESGLVSNDQLLDITDAVLRRMTDSGFHPAPLPAIALQIAVVQSEKLPAGKIDAAGLENVKRTTAGRAGLVFDKYKSGLVYAADAIDITSSVLRQISSR